MIDFSLLDIRAKKWAEEQFIKYYGKEEVIPDETVMELPQQEEVVEDEPQSGIRQATP